MNLLIFNALSWEQRKLGDVAKYRNGKAHENDIDDNGKYIVVNSKFVSTDGEVKKYSNTQIEPLMKDEIAFVLSDVPNGRAIARTFLVDESDKYTLNQRIAGITPLEKTYPYFLHILMNRNRYFLSFDDGAKQTNLSVADVMNFEEMYPAYDEQKKIGDFFNNLDNLITLHQSKAESWKNKKNQLSTKYWEQRKLGELYTERNERGNRSLQILSVSIHTGVSDGELDVDNLGKFIRRSEDKSTYKHVHSGDLIFNMMRAWQGAIGVAKTEGMISPAYISAIPSEDIYPPFMNYLLRRKNVINQINNLSYGVTDFRKRLYWNSFVQVNCKLPSVEEQRNITDVFEKIDNLITLHQSKAESWKNKKNQLSTIYWEQRKVQDIYKITRGYVLAAPETDENSSDDMPYPVYSSQTKNNGLMGYYKDYLYEDAITWTTDGANAGTVNYRAGKFYCTNVCGVLLSDEGYANKCAAEALNNVAWKWVSHVGNPKLMNNVMGEIPISLPRSIEEQDQISKFFEEIDNLITLHQRKLNRTQICINRSFLYGSFRKRSRI